MGEVKNDEWNGQRLFEKLQDLLDSDPDVSELGLIVSAEEVLKSVGNPQSTSAAKSDASSPFLLIEHNLGISFWCIGKLAKYTWASFNELVKTPPQDIIGKHATKAHQLTRTILLINADHYTAWNIRKQLLIHGEITAQTELKLSNLIFSKHPKSGESWAHRRWVIERFHDFDVSAEILICERTAELYPKNYYAWTHRRWVMEQMNFDQLVEELPKVKTWVRTHLSQNCAFRYLGMLVERIWRQDASAFETRVSQEFEFLDRLMEFYPGHESTWMYRRFLWLTLSKLFPHENIMDFARREHDFALKHIADKDVENYESQRKFAFGYQLWIWVQTLRSSRANDGDMELARESIRSVGNHLALHPALVEALRK
eukprot:TRINITY_DN14387_c0_g1_i1.p1 TRINITY_DN14387_c0_g1~~TRINITY_DN14387_c0_g1_i1.p1  ORF type:complete len:371 (+),score=85.96 TRINITY_DN14387_c0_g1_i1:285-1397(+)